MVNLKSLSRSNLFVFLIILCTGLLFYYSSLGNTFFSDDFNVIKRLVVDKQFWAPGFFRPLSDLTLLFVYNITGDSPFYQYLVNVLLLVLTSFFVYRFCVVYFKEREDRYYLGLLSAIFFTIYPFHNEAIVWAVGRASLLAAFFALISLTAVFSNLQLYAKIILANIFFFIGLLAYESIFPLPAIVLILLYKKGKPLKSYLPWLISYSVTFVIHLACRVIFSNSVFGNYQKDGLELHLTDYLVNFFKAFSRLWIMPINNGYLFIICFGGLLLSVLPLIYFLKKYQRGNVSLYTGLLQFFICILISLVIPSIFSVSIKTSEGDRLLFFPSLFVVIILALLMMSLKAKSILFYAKLLFITAYFSVNLVMNNSNWNHASGIIIQTLAQVNELAKESKKTEIINLPDSYYGAYIFRNGFKDALVMNNIDTQKINFIAPFMRWDYDSTANPIVLQCSGTDVLIPDYCSIVSVNNDQYVYHIIVKDTINYNADIRNETLWFWDKQQYKAIELK